MYTARAAIAVVLEEAAKVAESYEPRCDVCPSGVAAAIRAMIPKEGV
jgi:adenine-specific DNA glycosylase